MIFKIKFSQEGSGPSIFAQIQWGNEVAAISYYADNLGKKLSLIKNQRDMANTNRSANEFKRLLNDTINDILQRDNGGGNPNQGGGNSPADGSVVTDPATPSTRITDPKMIGDMKNDINQSIAGLKLENVTLPYQQEIQEGIGMGFGAAGLNQIGQTIKGLNILNPRYGNTEIISVDNLPVYGIKETGEQRLLGYKPTLQLGLKQKRIGLRQNRIGFSNVPSTELQYVDEATQAGQRAIGTSKPIIGGTPRSGSLPNNNPAPSEMELIDQGGKLNTYKYSQSFEQKLAKGVRGALDYIDPIMNAYDTGKRAVQDFMSYDKNIPLSKRIEATLNNPRLRQDSAMTLASILPAGMGASAAGTYLAAGSGAMATASIFAPPAVFYGTYKLAKAIPGYEFNTKVQDKVNEAANGLWKEMTPTISYLINEDYNNNVTVSEDGKVTEAKAPIEWPQEIRAARMELMYDKNGKKDESFSKLPREEQLARSITHYRSLQASGLIAEQLKDYYKPGYATVDYLQDAAVWETNAKKYANDELIKSGYKTGFNEGADMWDAKKSRAYYNKIEEYKKINFISEDRYQLTENAKWKQLTTGKDIVEDVNKFMQTDIGKKYNTEKLARLGASKLSRAGEKTLAEDADTQVLSLINDANDDLESDDPSVVKAGLKKKIAGIYLYNRVKYDKYFEGRNASEKTILNDPLYSDVVNPKYMYSQSDYTEKRQDESNTRDIIEKSETKKYIDKIVTPDRRDIITEPGPDIVVPGKDGSPDLVIPQIRYKPGRTTNQETTDVISKATEAMKISESLPSGKWALKATANSTPMFGNVDAQGNSILLLGYGAFVDGYRARKLDDEGNAVKGKDGNYIYAKNGGRVLPATGSRMYGGVSKMTATPKDIAKYFESYTSIDPEAEVHISDLGWFKMKDILKMDMSEYENKIMKPQMEIKQKRMNSEFANVNDYGDDTKAMLIDYYYEGFNASRVNDRSVENIVKKEDLKDNGKDFDSIIGTVKNKDGKYVMSEKDLLVNLLFYTSQGTFGIRNYSKNSKRRDWRETIMINRLAQIDPDFEKNLDIYYKYMGKDAKNKFKNSRKVVASL